MAQDEKKDTDLAESYGVKPFVFRGDWHFFKMPYVLYGSVPFTHFWENCPNENTLATMSDEEKRSVGTAAQLGLEAFTTLNRAFFSNTPSPLGRTTLFRLEMARTDLYTVVALVKFLPNELWNALYHGHQSAEKSLKAFLIAKGRPDSIVRKAHRHDLSSLIEACAGYDERFRERLSLLPFMAWESDWRYTPHTFPKQAVANMFDCAMILLADVVDALIPSPHSQWPGRMRIQT